MQRIPFGSSPTKENATLLQQSPNKKGKSLVLQQLVSFMKNSGITLPPSLAKMISNGLSCDEPLKQPMTSRQNVDDSKKLKIQLSDVQFQYKKLEQDFAQFKRSTRQEREKQIKRYENTINLLKNSLENTNQDYTYSISKQKQTHVQEITHLKERLKLQLQQQVTKIKNEYQKKIDSQSNLQKRQLSQLQRNQEHRYNQKVSSLQQQIKKNKISHSNQLKDINLRHKKIIQEKDKKHDSVRVALESQRKTQEKLHQKTKLEAKKQKQQLITELCYQKNVNIQLKEQIQVKDREIVRLKNTIRDKDIDIQLLEQKYKKQINDKQAIYRQNIEQLKKYQSQQILSLKNAQKQEIQTFQNRLQKIEIIQKEKEELMMTNIQDLSNNFQRRPSKRQDISELQKMKYTVAKKEEQIRKLSKELKHCSLQLENKEQMYTRIFRANSKNKEFKSKEQKQQIIVEEKLLKEPLFRKSHTSDIKLLLKMFKNNKDGQ